MTDKLLNATEIAELLSVPTTWIRQETRAGRLPHIVLGRYRRYDREAVLAWLEGQHAGQWRKHKPRVGIE
jgi:excisionase family DNA binding protein